jgi:hypothetical protein
MRVQMAYDGALFAGPVVVSSLGLRPDGGAAAAGKTVDGPYPYATRPDYIDPRQAARS